MAVRPPFPSDLYISSNGIECEGVFSPFYQTAEQLEPQGPDSPRTPPASPRGKMEVNDPSFHTPERLKDAVNSIRRDNLVFCSPDRNGKQTIAEGMEALHQLSTPDRKRKASDVMDTVINQIALGTDQEVDHSSADFHRAASERLQEEGLSETGRRVIRLTAQAMGQSPKRIVSIKHITTLGRTGGCHVDSLISGIKTDILAVNPCTNVKFALLDDKKLSTLFPPEIRISEVLALANESGKIAQQNNRSLRMSPFGFPIEVYTRDNILITSVFPVFFFDHYTPSKTYLLTANTQVSSEELLTAAYDVGAKIAYCTRNPQDNGIEAVVMDLASYFEMRTNVNKGVLFSFDRNTAPDLLNYYSQFAE
jgi:hypothetical protein